MKPVAAGAVASRRAALLVHSLSPSDRAWLLGSLPSGLREDMQGLLEELRDMDVPQDTCRLRELLDDGAAPEIPTPAERLASIDYRQRKELVRVLREEPPALTRQLLALGPWPWVHALSHQLPPGAARAMPQSAFGRHAPSLEQAICEGLLRRLEAAGRRRRWRFLSGWRGLLMRLTAWGRRR